MKKITVLGTGVLGQTLANGFKKNGYEDVVGTQHPERAVEWKFDSLKGVELLGYEEAAKRGELIVFSIKGTAAEEVAKKIAQHVVGKTIIDTTNPFADVPPVNGVLTLFTDFNESLMEKLQKAAPGAHFVKSFNSAGAPTTIEPDFGGVRPSMFFCGNDEGAKKEVAEIIAKFGWDPEDMGKIEASRVIEPLSVLWGITGILKNDWYHAFKVLKK